MVVIRGYKTFEILNDRRFWLSTVSDGGLLFERTKSNQKCVETKFPQT
jgi:hypothetical protein